MRRKSSRLWRGLRQRTHINTKHRFSSAAYEVLEERRLLAVDLKGFATALPTALEQLETGGLASEIFKTDMPLVGAGLDVLVKAAGDNATKFLSKFASDITAPLAALSDNPTESDFLNSISTTLDGFTVSLTHASGDPTTDNSVEYVLSFARTEANAFTASIPLDAGLGLPGLGINLSSNVNADLKLWFEANLQIGLTSTGDFFIDTAASTDELAVHASISLADGSIVSGKVGLLSFSATASNPTSLQVDYAANLVDSDGELHASEMPDGIDFQSTVTVEAHARLAMTTKFTLSGSTDFNPEIDADFSLDWSFNGGLPDDGSISDLGSTAPTVSFDHVRLDVKSAFLDNILRPALTEIHQFTGPLEPIANELESMPLEKAGYDKTLLQLLNLPPAEQKFFDMALQVVDLAKSADSASSSINSPLSLELGSFEMHDVRQDGHSFEGTPTDAADFLSKLDVDIPGVTSALSALNADMPDDSGLVIPMLQHPSELFNFFLGDDTTTLFEFTVPGLNYTSPYDPETLASFEIPPFGPTLTVNAVLTTGYAITGNLTIGYDAHGLRQVLDGGPVSDLINGIFIDNSKPLLTITGLDADGKPTDQIAQLQLNVTASADASQIVKELGLSVPGWLQTLIDDVVPVSASVVIAGDINLLGHLTVNLTGSPNSHFRLSDLGDSCIFDVNGKVDLSGDATFQATASAKIPLESEVGGLINAIAHVEIVPTEVSASWKKTLFTIGPQTIFSYVSTCVGDPATNPPVADPKLAYLEPDGTLRLNVGQYVGSFDANSRQIETTEINETYKLAHVSGSPNDPGGETVSVTAFGQTQQYSGVKSIVGDAGAGNDDIDLGDTLAPSALYGGDGDDRLTAGKGNAFIYGQGGNDTLKGGDGNDTMDGGDGDDDIQGGGGDDTIVGGTGTNTISGGDGHDTLYENANVNWTLDGTAGTLTGNGYNTDNITDIDVVDITGGVAANIFTVTQWSGEVHLHGEGGDDQFFIEIVGSGNSKYVVDDSSGNDMLTVRGTDLADHFTVQVGKITEAGGEEVDYTDMEHVLVDGKAGQDLIDVRSVAANVPLEVDGGDDSDLIRVSSNAGIDDNGDLSQILGALTIDAGKGGANRLVISNYGGDTTNPIVMQDDGDGFSSIAGWTATPIKYKATDGAYLALPSDFTSDPDFYVNYDHDNGVIVRGSNTSGEQFDINSTSIYISSEVQGNGGDDNFTVGNGDLNAVQGKVNAVGGDGTDHIDVKDDGNALVVDYVVTPTSVTSSNSPDAPAGQVARTFGGLAYDGTSEFLRLDCSDGKNTIEVHPSLNTEFYIDGNKPDPGTVCPDDGDYLRLITDGTTGRKISFTARGTGEWTFTSPHRAVKFENIEKFNHVEWVAIGADVATKGKSKPVVQVWDSETNELLFQIDPEQTFGINNFYGVHVAMGDLDGDGILDLIIAPGRNTAPDIKVFAGRPQPGVQGTLMTTISAANTYGKNFKGGVNVAVADVTGDCMPDLIMAPALGTPTIKVFRNDAIANNGNATLVLANSFNAFPDLKGYIGGASIAAADFDGVRNANGDLQSELVVGTGPGVKARWRLYDVKTVTPQILRTVMDPSGFTGGISVAAGDVTGDGLAEVVTSPNANGNSWIRVYSGSGTQLASYRAFPAAADVPNAAVHITLRDLNDDGKLEVLATQGQDGRSQYHVKKFSALTGTLIDTYFASSPDFYGGGLTIG